MSRWQELTDQYLKILGKKIYKGFSGLKRLNLVLSGYKSYLFGDQYYLIAVLISQRRV